MTDNDFITLIQRNQSFKDINSSQVHSAWNSAKEFVKASAVSENDVNFYPLVMQKTMALLQNNGTNSKDEQNNNSIFKKENSVFQAKEALENIIDKNNRNPKFSRTQYVMNMIAEFKDKGILDSEIINKLVDRLRVNADEAEMLLQSYNLIANETKIGNKQATAPKERQVGNKQAKLQKKYSPGTFNYSNKDVYVEQTLKEASIKELEYMDWREKSSKEKATVRFLIGEHLYEMNFTYMDKDRYNWNYEWKELIKMGISKILMVTVAQLNGNFDNLSISKSASNINYLVSDSFFKAMNLAFQMYFEMFATTSQVQFIIFNTSSNNYSNYNIVQKYMNEYFIKKYRNFSFDDIVSNYLTNSTRIPNQIYYAFKNNSKNLLIEEEDAAVQSTDFNNAVPENMIKINMLRWNDSWNQYFIDKLKKGNSNDWE